LVVIMLELVLGYLGAVIIGASLAACVVAATIVFVTRKLD